MKLECPYLILPGNQGFTALYNDNRWRLQDWHTHPLLEMNFVLRGHGELLLEDRKYPLLPGHIVWIFPNQRHMPSRWADNLEMWIVECTADVIASLPPKTRKALSCHQPDDQYCRCVEEDDKHTLDHLLSGLRSTMFNPLTFNRGLPFAVSALWDAYAHGHAAVDAIGFDPKVEKALDLINQPGGMDLSVLRLAEIVRLAPRHLSVHFQEQVGHTIPQYRNRLRIQQFFKMHEKHPAWDLTTLALEAGFGSYAQFFRIFKEYVGCAPQLWIR